MTRYMDRSMVATSSTTTTRAGAGAGDYGDVEKKKKKRRQGGRSGARMGRCPSLEALAMAGCQCMPAAEEEQEEEEGMPPEHLRAFEAYLEEVVPPEMILESQREEAARVRRGGKSRSYDDDMKEKLRLWARAVAKTTAGRT